MTHGPIAIIGAGGHGREVLQVARRAGLFVVAVYDDSNRYRDLIEALDVTFGGAVARCAQPAYIGIGSGLTRQRLQSHMTIAPPIIDPSAVVGTDVSLGDGSVVFAMATVTTNISIGRHVHVGRGAAVGHDCILDDYVSVMPLACISGNVSVGRAAYIGAGAMIRQGLRIGEGATIGMGAVVLADVPTGATVVGSPARAIR